MNRWELIKKFPAPVDLIKSGWYSDKYFIRAAEIVRRDENRSSTTMQVFCKKQGILCGINEALAIIRFCVPEYEKLKISCLDDGDEIKPWETVMTIEGEYGLFAALETVLLGVIARGTSTASSVKKTVEAAAGKPVLFFAARFDHYAVQAQDGYAAKIGGAAAISTDAGALFWDEEGAGTIPHGLIAAYEGDTVLAAQKFDRYIDEDVDRIVLVDWDNDCINTSLKTAEKLKNRLWGVRFDTSERIRDKSVVPVGKDSLGVCPELVFKARKIFDDAGYKELKIVVSGGFDEEKIKLFEKLNVPVDAYGVGSSLLKEKIDFTADVVLRNGKHCAKVGRRFRPNPRMNQISWNEFRD